MRIAVLSNPASWYFLDLKRAAEDQQVDLIPISFSHLAASLGHPHDPGFFAEQTSFNDWDMILVRSMPPGSLEQVIFDIKYKGSFVLIVF